MAWWGKSVRDQRVEFVIRVSRGESLSALCREFGNGVGAANEPTSQNRNMGTGDEAA
jgi:hypothetical protein